MRKFFAALCLLLFVAPTFAESSPRWLQVKTDHFTVLTDSSERQVRHTAGQLERMHAIFAKLLPNATDDPASRIVVLALRDRKDFQSVEPASYLAKNTLDLAGLFMRGDDRNYILLRLDSAGDHPYATVYHEYTHYMVRHIDFLPVWLNEGEAEFFQNTDILDHDVRLGQADVNSLLFLRQEKLIPLETLFRVDANSPYYHEESKGNIFYAESWALTHFLFMQDFGKQNGRIRAYMQHLQQGESSVAAAEHAFGDLRTLQAQLALYIQSGDYKALGMKLQDEVDEKGFEVQPLATTDADAVRADVLARNGRTREAEALDRAVLAEAPGNAQAHESMGFIKLREGDTAQAGKWFNEAVGLHSTSFLAFYYAGALSLQDGASSPETTAGSLREAIKLNPHFAPALESLAQCDAMHNENLDEALEMSLRAVQLDPHNIEYRLNASEIRVTRKELSSAISGLQATAKLARTAEERSRVQARLEQLQTYQDQNRRMADLRTEAATEIAAEAKVPQPSGPAAVRDGSGRILHPVTLEDSDHKYPEGPATGPKHTATGTLHNVGCFYPKGLTLKVEAPGRPVSLYSNDMYAISYTAGNFTPTKDLNPCQDFNGLKAKVTYAEVKDATVAGQILSMELSK